jgi:hypothetical protein
LSRRAASPLLAAAVGIAVAWAAAPRGVADSAAWTFEARVLAGPTVTRLGEAFGDATALRLDALGAAALSAGLAFVALRRAAGARVGVAAAVTLAALASTPMLTGWQAATPGSACLGLAVLALAAWRDRPAVGAALSLLVGLWSPPTGTALAVAGAIVGGRLDALLLAALVAALGRGGQVDVTGADNLVLFRVAATPAGGVAIALAAMIVPGDRRMRFAALAAALLAIGPVVVANGRPVPLPAALPAALGASGGWAGAGVVAVAALALGVATAEPPRSGARVRALAGLALVVAEGLGMATRPLTPYPSAPPEVARALAERDGTVLVLPVSRLGAREARRAPLWRHLAARFDRRVYAGGEAVASTDPVLGTPAVAAILTVLEPEESWLIPPHDEGNVLRSLGITELVLDREACSTEELARIDPVLARLFGAPQRDLRAGADLWRIDPLGQREFPVPPYLRHRGDPNTRGWQTIEQLIAAPSEAPTVTASPPG